MNWLDYRKQLGLNFNDKEKDQYFITKIFNILEGINGEVNREEYFAFFNTTGTIINNSYKYYADSDRYNNIISTIKNFSNNLVDFLVYYVAFINALENGDNNKKCFLNILKKMLDESKIQFDILEDMDGYFVFPKGAMEFDDALVSQPLEWLKKYPNTHKTFCIALKQYADMIFIRDVADNLRKALEDFFKEFLNNGKNLDNNITEICRYIGSNNAEPELAGILKTLLNSYDTLNNKIAKHNDKVDPIYLEFLLYQTGLFIRLLITIKAVNSNNITTR